MHCCIKLFLIKENYGKKIGNTSKLYIDIDKSKHIYIYIHIYVKHIHIYTNNHLVLTVILLKGTKPLRITSSEKLLEIFMSK